MTSKQDQVQAWVDAYEIQVETEITTVGSTDRDYRIRMAFARIVGDGFRLIARVLVATLWKEQ